MKVLPITICLGALLTSCGAKSIQLDNGSPGGGATDAGAGTGTLPAEWSLFVDDPGMVDSLVVDETRLYWCTQDPSGAGAWAKVQSCLKETCSSVTTYESITFDLTGDAGHRCGFLIADSKNLYWANRSGVVRCPLSGCVDHPALITDAFYIRPASDGEYLYWPSDLDTAIFRCPVSGCGAFPQVLALNQSGLDSSMVVVDGTHVYWIANARLPSASIMRMVKDGSGPPAVFAKDQNQAASLALDAHDVYWTNTYSVGTVFRCPVSGCDAGPTVLSYNQAYPIGIVTDGTDVYWMTNERNSQIQLSTLVKCPSDGCGSMPDALGNAAVYNQSIAIDDKYLYWAAGPMDTAALVPHTRIYRRPK